MELEFVFFMHCSGQYNFQLLILFTVALSAFFHLVHNAHITARITEIGWNSKTLLEIRCTTVQANPILQTFLLSSLTPSYH